MIRRVHVVLALLVGGGVAAAAAGLPWARVTGLRDGDALLLMAIDTEVTGAEVAPLVTASALVALAAAGTLALSGRVARVVALAVAAAAGAGATVSTVSFVRYPDGPAADAVTQTGPGPADAAVTTLTAWPWVSLVGAVVVLVAGVAGLVQARRWDAVTRFETPAARVVDDEQPHPGDDWDALTRDEDPTQERPGGATAPPG